MARRIGQDIAIGAKHAGRPIVDKQRLAGVAIGPWIDDRGDHIRGCRDAGVHHADQLTLVPRNPGDAENGLAVRPRFESQRELVDVRTLEPGIDRAETRIAIRARPDARDERSGLLHAVIGVGRVPLINVRRGRQRIAVRQIAERQTMAVAAEPHQRRDALEVSQLPAKARGWIQVVPRDATRVGRGPCSHPVETEAAVERHARMNQKGVARVEREGDLAPLRRHSRRGIIPHARGHAIDELADPHRKRRAPARASARQRDAPLRRMPPIP